MSVAFSQSPLLKPARFLWRRVLKFAPVRRYVERRLLYPDLPHIQRTNAQTAPQNAELVAQCTRQSALETVQQPVPQTDEPLLLAGLFSSNLGLGEAARLELEWQRSQGRNVVGVDVSGAFGLSDLAVPEGVVSLADAPKHGPLILHCNAPEMGRALHYLGKELTADRHITGYWAWELETPPHDWELAYKYIDELWVPSTHTAKAFSAAPVPVSVHPPIMRNIPDGGHSFVDLGFPDLSDKTVFLSMADGRSDLVRKNIAGAVRAFGEVCGNCESAALIIKLHHTEFSGKELVKVRELCARYSNVHLMEACFTSAQRNSLLHRIQAVISLYRAEGYGLLLAEAKMLGKKIIATAYSSPMDFLDDSVAELIPYALVSVQADTANYGGYGHAVWAEPEKASAAEAISRVLKLCANNQA